MATNAQANRRSAPPRGGWLLPALALVLAASAASGALWLSAASRSGPWVRAIGDLTTSGENCSLEADAAARVAAKVARSQSQLEGFVRERFEQLHERAIAAHQTQQLAAIETARAQAATAPIAGELDEAMQLRSRLAALVAQRAQLLDRFTPEHPQIAELSQQIDAAAVQVAALGPPPVSPVPAPPETVEIEPVPADAWKSLVEQSAADYERLATACRRADRQLDEVQAGQSAALDRHLRQLGQLETVVTAWDRLAAAATTVGQTLWCIAAVALAGLGWLAWRGALEQWRPRAEQVITRANQIERWFSLPFVTIAATADGPATPHERRRALVPHWLVLPAQLAFAMAVLLVVAATIQNPTWLNDVAGTPWQAIGQFWDR